MNLLTNLFRSRKKSPKELYNFKTINHSEITNYTYGIDALKDGSIDGFLIKNVLSKEEVKKLVNGYKKLDPKEINHINSGLSLFPKPFSLVDQLSEKSRENLGTYFQKAERLWHEFPETFGFDFVTRIKETLNILSGSKHIEIPKGVDQKGIYNPATFKEMSPDVGELKAHCGNYFQKEFSTFYDHLEESSNIKDQLSYFVMLDPSESGGELTLYDLRWDNVKIRLKGDTVLVDEKGKKHDLLNPKKIKRISIAPEAGDMIVFSGGQIWHKVEYIKGSKNRMTLGGFLSFTKDNKGLYMWS
jgi:hypothetical protein